MKSRRGSVDPAAFTPSCSTTSSSCPSSWIVTSSTPSARPQASTDSSFGSQRRRQPRLSCSSVRTESSCNDPVRGHAEPGRTHSETHKQTLRRTSAGCAAAERPSARSSSSSKRGRAGRILVTAK